ncbi:MAG: hypothetical protein DMG65_23505 [Candidatus Angelobacter sp. Gp1-AA117]|nr:MAG: hypothetical protein DMG65_23505 [Candidatus Angelobacter sp. Gp1-AA117]
MATTIPKPEPESTEQPPYGIILKALRTGNAVPFLGAGASMLKSCEESPLLPSGSALAELLAEQARFPSTDPHDRTDLAKVTSYYVDVSSRSMLRDELRSKFIGQNYKYNRALREN